MQVVEMLFRNFVDGNFTDNCDKCWFSSEHNGILHKHNFLCYLNDYPNSTMQSAEECCIQVHCVKSSHISSCQAFVSDVY